MSIFRRRACLVTGFQEVAKLVVQDTPFGDQASKGLSVAVLLFRPIAGAGRFDTHVDHQSPIQP
jgi:hypothetical protein